MVRQGDKRGGPGRVLPEGEAPHVAGSLPGLPQLQHLAHLAVVLLVVGWVIWDLGAQERTVTAMGRLQGRGAPVQQDKGVQRCGL